MAFLGLKMAIIHPKKVQIGYKLDQNTNLVCTFDNDSKKCKKVKIQRRMVTNRGGLQISNEQCSFCFNISNQLKSRILAQNIDFSVISAKKRDFGHFPSKLTKISHFFDVLRLNVKDRMVEEGVFKFDLHWSYFLQNFIRNSNQKTVLTFNKYRKNTGAKYEGGIFTHFCSKQ